MPALTCDALRNKDRGYAWAVLALSALSHAVHVGFSFAIVGNLTVEHQKYFNVSSQEASYMSSIHTGMLFLLAPLASVMVHKLSCRITQVTGGLCLIGGVALCSVATQPWHIYLLFSVIAAWGSSCCYIATSHILTFYFDKYNYLSFGIVVLGMYAGLAAWPSGSQMILDTLGYRKAMGYMSCVHVVHVIAGLLFITPTTNVQSSQSSGNTDKISEEADLAMTNQAFSPEGGEDGSQMVDNSKHEPVGASDTKPELEQRAGNSLITDFKGLLTSLQVWALLLNCMFWCGSVSSFLVLVSDYIIHSLQVTHGQAAVGLTVAGSTNIAGTLLVVLTSRLDYSRLLLHFCCPIVFGLATLSIAFSVNTAMYYSLAGVWGLFQGALIANLLAVTYTFAGRDKLTSLFGVLLLFEGIGGLSATPICGYLAVQYGSMYSLLFSGLCGVVSSFFLLPLVIYRCRQSDDQEETTPNTKEMSAIR